MLKSRTPRRFLPVVLVLTVAAAILSTQATTVSDFCIEDLVRHADTVVRAHVLTVTPLNEEETRHVLRIDEVIVGDLESDVLNVDLLHVIEGMPELGAGEEIVVFLNFENRIERVLGLRWGTFRVKDDRVFNHEWNSLELSREARDGRDQDFLRQRRDKQTSIEYSQLRSRIVQTRERIRADSRRTDPTTPVELNRN